MKRILLSLAIFGFTSMNAGDLGKGIKAYQQGDAKAAITYFKKACDSGIANGCYNVGSMYHQGLGVQKNINKAMDLYDVACNDGYHDGCYNLGIMYFKGKDINKNLSKAKLFFEKAYKIDVTDVDSRFKASYLRSQGY